MKNKKKIVSLFFLLLLIFSSVLALSSCGQSETNRERLEEALYAKVSEELYTSASYETYTIAYNQAKELLKKENATALELERALEELTEAKKNLVKKADFSQLKLAVESHEKIKESSYTLSSYKAYTEAYEAALLVYNRDSATQGEINAVVIALNNAIKGLILLPDNSSLQELVKEHIEAGGYTSSSYRAYEEAYTLAMTLLQQENPAVSELKVAENRLKQSIAQLVKRGDVSVLSSKIEYIRKNLLIADEKGREPRERYASAGYLSLMSLMERAEEYLSTGDISQEELSLFLADLDLACGRLVDLGRLLDVYETASGYAATQSDKVYTEGSYNTLSVAMVEAYNFSKKTDVTADEVEDAVKKLESAIEGMERITVHADGEKDKSIGSLTVRVGATSVTVNGYMADYTGFFRKMLSENLDFIYNPVGEGVEFGKGKVKVFLGEKTLRITVTGDLPLSQEDLAAVTFGNLNLGSTEFMVAEEENMGNPTSYESRVLTENGKEYKIAILTYENEDDGLKMTVQYDTIGQYIRSVEFVQTENPAGAVEPTEPTEPTEPAEGL